VILERKSWENHFALVDCSSFYASCEKLFHPRLHDLPLIVLSNNDGCVVSRCREAKRLGIPLGAPVFKIRDLIENHRVTVLSSNYELYGDISRRVMECLRRFSPQIEPYSIDEAFLQHNIKDMPLRPWAVSLQHSLRQSTGIGVTVGIGPTKILAKVASHIAKNRTETEGVFCLASRDEIRAALNVLEVSELWGIGHRYRKKLKTLHIERVQQLLDLGETWMEKHLGGVVGRRLWWELQGVSCRPLSSAPSCRRQIAFSRSFSNPVEDVESLENVICQYVTCAVNRLRDYALSARRMTVFLKTNSHRPRLPQHHPMLFHCFPQAGGYTPEFIAAGKKLLHAMYRPGHRYIKAGVILWDLCGREELTPHLFLPEPRRKERFMETVDALNRKMGSNTLRPASFQQTTSWQMRRSHMSPRYTTRWAELPEVGKCLFRETGESPTTERPKPPASGSRTLRGG